MQTVSQHFHTTIIGGQANLGSMGPSSIGGGNAASVGNSQVNGLQDATVRQLLSELRSHAVRLSGEDNTEALEAIQKIEAQLAKPKPDLERIKQYLSLYGTIVTVAAPTVEKLIQYLVPLITG
jgi:hypothetical protein